jgi:hypothetical protein
MNNKIENLFQSIGNQILDVVGDDVTQVLAYAEAEDGTVSVALFVKKQQQDIPYFKFGGEHLSNLFYQLWSAWEEINKEGVWSSCVYFISNGKPRLEIIYPDKFDKQASENMRRSAILEKYFGPFDTNHPNL